MRIALNVKHGCVQSSAIFQRNQSVCFQKQKSSCFIGCIIGNGDGCAVRKRIKRRCFTGVNGKWLIVDIQNGNKMSSSFLIETLKIGDMLKIIGIQLSAFG